tara:strand:+ start:65 stop:760 length:696 start_codon:yes stop_codon:yes gene_type:complete
MIATDKFIFIHLFRTGGTTINSSLKGKLLGYHRPRSLIPREYLHLPVVGNVRNPFDWYVSVYYHCLNYCYPMKTPTFINFILDFKRYSFKESIRRLVDTSWMTSVDREKCLSHFPLTYNWDGTLLDNLRRTECQSYLDSGVGYLSWLFNYMYQYNGTTKGVIYKRLEDLKNYPKLNAMTGFNSIIGNIREPRNSNYMSYYDDDLIQLILNKDGDYIKRFNYLDNLEDKMYD